MRKVSFLLNPRSLLALLHDILIATLAWITAYLLRFNFDVPPEFLQSIMQNLIWVLPMQTVMFIGFGLYQGVWRFASLPDLKRLLKAVTVSTLVMASILLMFKPFGIVPRSVLILDPLLLILFMGGSRFAYRAWKEHQLYGATLRQGHPVLVLGAGDVAFALVKELERSAQWRVVGMLDDNESMHGRLLNGVQVLGSISMLADRYKRLEVKHVIIAMPSHKNQKRRQAIELANALGLEVLTVPSIEDLMSGKVSVSQVRKVDVEDLLGRDSVNLDNTGLLSLIKGNTVMVTGAGGSIGSELCRQIIKYQPNTLICLDVSEYSLYRLEEEFNLQKLPVKMLYLTGDVKSKQRVSNILSHYRPAAVFHAAAYKHVPLMENDNVWEALSNNVIGTYTLAQACKAAGVAKFVLISTDKAINPTNVMGASKRLAEMVCQGLQEPVLETSLASPTKFVIVRFGNVLGSSGSVIPKFKEQIAMGGPITITHPDITRYFMSIPEAAQLVMQASLMGAGGDIFVLDMGEPVKIAQLALDMIRLSGLQLEDIKIEYVGLRPGEKLFEELLADDEHTLPTPHEKLRIALARPVNKTWVNKLLKWIDVSQNNNETQIKNELQVWVEEYSPQHKNLNEAHPSVMSDPITLH